VVIRGSDRFFLPLRTLKAVEVGPKLEYSDTSLPLFLATVIESKICIL